MSERAEQYLNFYISMLPESGKYKVNAESVFHFGNTEECANNCAALTIQGKKRATASLEWGFTIGDEAYPEVGELNVITNWNNEPLCIIEVWKIKVLPFNEVNESFAIEEGEGDLSLKYWHKVHWEFFSQECQSLGKQPSENMPIVLQWFKVVHAK
jgi:uncharacterized protein YhfF